MADKKSEVKNKDSKIRKLVEDVFSKAGVDASATGRLTDADLHEIVEKTFTKAAVDKDECSSQEWLLRDVIERAYTKAAVDKDLPEVMTRLSSDDLKSIANKVLKED